LPLASTSMHRGTVGCVRTVTVTYREPSNSSSSIISCKYCNTTATFKSSAGPTAPINNGGQWTDLRPSLTFSKENASINFTLTGTWIIIARQSRRRAHCCAASATTAPTNTTNRHSLHATPLFYFVIPFTAPQSTCQGLCEPSDY
jgi:hypothetical protein